MYELKTLDEDTVLVNLSQVVRIYKNKDKVTFSDGSVLRVGPSDMARLFAAIENYGNVEASYAV